MLRRILRTPEGEGGGTTATNNPPGASGGDQQQQTQQSVDDQQQQQKGDDQQQQTTEDKKQTTGLTKDEITEILQSVEAARPSPTAKEEPKQLSPEEFKRVFNVWEPSEDLITKLRSEDPKVALTAFHEIRDGVIRQAMTLAEHRIQQLLGETTKSFQPVLDYVSEAKAEKLRSDFFNTNEDLKDFEVIVDAITTKFEANGTTFPSKEKMFEEVARQARAVLKQHLEKTGGKLPQKQTRMTTVSAGGQSGGGRGKSQDNGANPKLKEALALFD